ncbi:prostate stem cell antigen-like [Xenopus laevis]|uniref:Prostate stem cell antigen-like n=1 Tax=Xenopus laevis TaxID=8355 RepID=A0A8J1LKQ2_XENLA|nr:prostate stem cell antigen-like [Xenopus laevis]
MTTSTIFLSLMLLLQSGDSLKCYTCLFPTISPLECLKFPVSCPPSERCLTSTASGRKGDFQFVLRERGCAINSLCDTSGQRSTLGINVTFHNTCCDTDLCNAATAGKLTLGSVLLSSLLLFILFHP